MLITASNISYISHQLDVSDPILQSEWDTLHDATDGTNAYVDTATPDCLVDTRLHSPL